jgi:hypothetical protein
MVQHTCGGARARPVAVVRSSAFVAAVAAAEALARHLIHLYDE